MVDPHPLDALLSEDDADTAKLVESAATQSESTATEEAPPGGQTEVKPATEETDLPLAEPPAEPTPEEIPPEQTPPETAPEPEPEPPLAAKPEEKRGGPSRTNRAIRELTKQLAERDRRLAELEAAKAQAPAEAPVEDEFDDPITKLARERIADQKRIEQLEERTQQTERMTQQQQIATEVQRQEADFQREHPDYNDALNHLVKTRREEYEETGALDNRAEWWITNHPQVIERFANERNLAFESDDEVHAVAKEAAFAVMLEQERLQIIQDARARGKNVAQAVYGLATRRGWQTPSAKPAAPAPAAKPAESAQERVQRAKAAESAATSLSSMQSGAQPVELKITSRAQLLALDEKELDRYTDLMDSKDPKWLEKLT